MNKKHYIKKLRVLRKICRVLISESHAISKAFEEEHHGKNANDDFFRESLPSELKDLRWQIDKARLAIVEYALTDELKPQHELIQLAQLQQAYLGHYTVAARICLHVAREQHRLLRSLMGSMYKELHNLEPSSDLKNIVELVDKFPRAKTDAEELVTKIEDHELDLDVELKKLRDITNAIIRNRSFFKQYHKKGWGRRIKSDAITQKLVRYAKFILVIVIAAIFVNVASEVILAQPGVQCFLESEECEQEPRSIEE